MKIPSSADFRTHGGRFLRIVRIHGARTVYWTRQGFREQTAWAVTAVTGTIGLILSILLLLSYLTAIIPVTNAGPKTVSPASPSESEIDAAGTSRESEPRSVTKTVVEQHQPADEELDDDPFAQPFQRTVPTGQPEEKEGPEAASSPIDLEADDFFAPEPENEKPDELPFEPSQEADPFEQSPLPLDDDQDDPFAPTTSEQKPDPEPDSSDDPLELESLGIEVQLLRVQFPDDEAETPVEEFSVTAREYPLPETAVPFASPEQSPWMLSDADRNQPSPEGLPTIPTLYSERQAELLENVEEAPSSGDPIESSESAAETTGPKSVQLFVQRHAPEQRIQNRLFGYDLVVRNDSEQVLESVRLEEQIPRSHQVIDVTPPVPLDGETLHWELRHLEPGESRQLRVEVIPTEVGEEEATLAVRSMTAVSALTEVQAPDDEPAESDHGSNRDEFEIEDDTDSESADEIPEPSRSENRLVREQPFEGYLEVHCPTRVRLDQWIPVDVQVVNSGQTEARDVVVHLALPEGLSHRFGRFIDFRVGTLTAGESRQGRLYVRTIGLGELTIDAQLAGNNRRANIESVRLEVVPGVSARSPVPLHGPCVEVPVFLPGMFR